MEKKYKISIAKDFTKYPGGRFKSEGEFSGEEFLLNHLIGKVFAAIITNSIVVIDLTGMNGYPSSFLSGSFGKLSYEIGKVIGKENASLVLNKHINLICDDSEARIQAVINQINSPITKDEIKKSQKIAS